MGVAGLVVTAWGGGAGWACPRFLSEGSQRLGRPRILRGYQKTSGGAAASVEGVWSDPLPVLLAGGVVLGGQESGEGLGGGVPAQCFAGPGVEFLSDLGQVRGAV